jgi:hypothetical protein
MVGKAGMARGNRGSCSQSGFPDNRAAEPALIDLNDRIAAQFTSMSSGEIRDHHCYKARFAPEAVRPNRLHSICDPQKQAAFWSRPRTRKPGGPDLRKFFLTPCDKVPQAIPVIKEGQPISL